MKVTTRTAAALLLTCMTCARAAVAQMPRDARGAQAERAEIQAQRRAARLGRAGAAEITDSLSRTVRIAPGGTFEVDNIAGDISISGAAGSDARIDAVKRVRDLNDARARAALAGIRIEIAERGGNVEVRTIQPRVPLGIRAVDYVVTVPTGSNVIVRNGAGNVRVQNVSGEVRAENTNGAMTAAAVKNIRSLKSLRGNIEVSDSEADEFNVSTLSGNIVIRKLKGRLIDLQTITGNVQLLDVATQRAVLQSMAGDLEYAGLLAPSGRYQFQTHEGNIRVIPSGTPGFDLDAMTFSGALRSDFVLKMLRRQANGPRPRAERTLRGTFGDAGAVLTASSFSGNIVITKP